MGSEMIRQKTVLAVGALLSVACLSRLVAAPATPTAVDVHGFELLLEDQEGRSVEIHADGRAFARGHGLFQVSEAQAAEALQLLIDAGLLDLSTDLANRWVVKQAGPESTSFALQKVPGSAPSTLRVHLGPIDKVFSLSRGNPRATTLLEAIFIWVAKMTPSTS
jgi:hypothetical protein